VEEERGGQGTEVRSDPSSRESGSDPPCVGGFRAEQLPPETPFVSVSRFLPLPIHTQHKKLPEWEVGEGGDRNLIKRASESFWSSAPAQEELRLCEGDIQGPVLEGVFLLKPRAPLPPPSSLPPQHLQRLKRNSQLCL
jgi:hypothetical protein